jgi:SAM-dependent methyltransferase
MSTTEQPQPANANKALWEKGDFTRIAATMRASGEALVGSLGITEGLDVLDLGCGDGTTAIPEARLGANVLGVDIAENLVAAGNARARDLGLSNIRFQLGDASKLSELADDSFDSWSASSVRCSPAAGRCGPGGRAGDAAGRPDRDGQLDPERSHPGRQILRISAAYSPPPPEGFVSPMTWGIDDAVIERFGGAGVPADRVSLERDTYTFDFAGTPTQLLALFREYYGPTMNAYAAAAASGREADLHAELDALFNEQNASTEPGATTIPATFLRVTVEV